MKFKKPSKRQGVFVLGAVMLVGATGLSVYNYQQLQDVKNKHSDLSATHEDFVDSYYGVDEGHSDQGGSDAEFEILSQEVKQLRAYNSVAAVSADTTDEQFMPANVRVLSIKVTNNTGAIYSVYSLATVTGEGVVVRSVDVHPADDLNDPESSYGLELKDGGSTTRYFYFIDNGSEITEIGNADTGGI
jgi:hypothetical protein